MKALIDTCIVMDLLQKREPFFQPAHEIFLAAADRLFDGYLSAKAVSDIYDLMHRFLHDDRKTRKALGTLFELFSIADTMGEDCIRAADSGITDYEDAVMAETALRIGADCLVTRNIKDFLQAPVRILDPAAFLGRIKPSGTAGMQEIAKHTEGEKK